MLNPEKVRKDFPIFARKINRKPLIYLDNAATAQKPKSVIDAIANYYKTSNANVHRGVHTLAEESTQIYEQAHVDTAKFINAPGIEDIIFTKNTTEAMNLLTYSWGEKNINAGDEIVLSSLDHHSNIVPWQQLAIRKKARLVFLPLTNNGLVDMEKAKSLITKKTKIVSVSHASNVLGTILPAKEMADIAHDKGALVALDGAQSVPHLPVDVRKLDCDFLAFSAHKMLGPTGIGVVYGKEEHLLKMNPFLYGGDMIAEVTFQSSTWNALPWKFEAGTPNVADAAGFSAALSYLQKIGMKNVRDHDQKLTAYALKELPRVKGIRLYGPANAQDRTGLVAFNLKNVHAHDAATLLNDDGIAIRAGHHCAQPLADLLKIGASARASFYLYNTKKEVDALIDSLQKVNKLFS